jgi:hypothetical protein
VLCNLPHAAAAAAAAAAVPQVELFTGRLTNFPPFLPLPLRNAAGIAMGALPHALESVLGYGFDLADGGHYYAAKRDAAFNARHPGAARCGTRQQAAMYQADVCQALQQPCLWGSAV